MSLSLNTIVKVRLTQDGIRRHREFYRSFMPEKLFDEYYQPPDKDGVLRTELWQVMQIFGPVMSHGSGASWFGTAIEIDNSDNWKAGRYLLTKSDGKTCVIECFLDQLGMPWMRFVGESQCWKACKWNGCSYSYLGE